MSSSSAAHLPVEIWRQIADHMSTTAWARVSRTCKAMHSVQLEQISIGVRSESALAWVHTHWGQASTLKLHWQQEDILWIVAHNAASVTSLKRLELRLMEEGSPTTTTVLTWLLAQAPQLQLLLVHHPKEFVVSSIHNLSHLILQSIGFTATTAASIRQLRNLRTLWLGITYTHPYNACVDLDLAPLPQLMDVCLSLQNASPEDISLPRHCRLHLFGDDGNLYEYTMWNDIARHGQFRSASLRAVSPDLYNEIPLLMLGWKCSFLKWWQITHLGVVSSPVEFDAAHFRCLTHLKLSGEEIHIQLPQELLLQVLDVHAGRLSIICTNAQEQAKRLQQVKVVYGTLENPDVPILVGLMCALGATVRKAGAWEGSMRQGLLVSYQREPVDWKCPCGACFNCLRHV